MKKAVDRASMPHRVRYAAQQDHVAELLSPTNGYRGNLLRRGVKPKDHEKENRRNIRRMQENRRDGGISPAKSAFKMRCFQGVQSRVFEPEDKRPATADAAKSFLRRGEGVLSKEPNQEEAQMRTTRINSLTKPRVPRENEWMKMAPRSSTNFIRSNIQEACLVVTDDEVIETSQASIPPPPPGKRTALKSPVAKSPGEIPKYLKVRMQELAEEEAERKQRAREENEAPPGLKLMPKKEQRETLEVLQKSRVETQRQLTAMPLDLTTPHRRRRKEELESKLLEIEQAIRVFQNPQVFVQR